MLRQLADAFARAAENRDIASLWVSDHVIFPRKATGSYPGGRFPHPPDKAYLEPVVALAAAAVCTSRARLGASVFILGHRHPVVMAKMLTSIDALSNGRLICGVGVGWWKEEIEILGAPFHERGRQADEMLRVFNMGIGMVLIVAGLILSVYGLIPRQGATIRAHGPIRLSDRWLA